MSETLPKPSSIISFIPFGDGGALFYPGIQRLWALNHLASYIWLRLDENISKNSLVNELVDKFSIDSTIIENDITQIIEHFKKEGLLGSTCPTKPNTTKDIDYFTSDEQRLKSFNSSETEFKFSTVIEANGFSCEIKFPNESYKEEFEQLYHYFIVTDDQRVQVCKKLNQIIIITPSSVHNDHFELYLNELCVHENVAETQIYSAVHFIFFSNCAKYLSRQGKLMFHAAALQKGDKTIVFPANSGSGKSTLTAALSSSGWCCFTDELAIFDLEALSLAPLPIPMRIRSGSFTPLQPYYPKLNKLKNFQDLYENQIRWIILPKNNLAAKSTSAQITTLIFPKYTENAKTTLISLDKFIALERLTLTGSSERDMTLEDAKAMVRLIEQTPCYELIFSDLQEAIAAIESIKIDSGDHHSRAGGNPVS